MIRDGGNTDRVEVRKGWAEVQGGLERLRTVMELGAMRVSER